MAGCCGDDCWYGDADGLGLARSRSARMAHVVAETSVKHVVVSIPYGLAFRNLVCCGILRRLAQSGARLTVLLPPTTTGDQAVLRDELPSGTRIEALHSMP